MMSWNEFIGGHIQFQNEYDSRGGARGAGTVRVWSLNGRRYTDMRVASVSGTEIGTAFWCGDKVQVEFINSRTGSRYSTKKIRR